MSFCTATVPPLEVVAVKFRENVVDSFTGGVSRVRPRAEGPGEPLQPQREHQQLPRDPRAGRDRCGGQGQAGDKLTVVPLQASCPSWAPRSPTSAWGTACGSWCPTVSRCGSAEPRSNSLLRTGSRAPWRLGWCWTRPWSAPCPPPSASRAGPRCPTWAWSPGTCSSPSGTSAPALQQVTAYY